MVLDWDFFGLANRTNLWIAPLLERAILSSGMLRINALKEGLMIAQEITSPSVYLDHWAWRQISECENHTSRFATALSSRHGTLVISWLNVVEFSKVSDDAQRFKADLLLNRLALNTFWLNPDFFSVIKHEGRPLPKNGMAPPHSDMHFADFFVREAIRASKSVALLGSPSLFSAIYRSPEIREQYDNLADDIIAQLQHFRGEFQSRKAMRKAVAASPQRDPHSRPTRFIARNLIGHLLKDKLQKLDRNNAIDLCHAVVAVSYCDYVLLDAQWAGYVNESRRLIAEAHLSMPVATVFSKKSNGVEEFLTAIEARS